MREMGIAGIAPGPNLSKRLTEHRVYPYLLRGITAQRPNHIWGCDITYIRLRHGWLYLVAIIDWFSRYVISWMLDDTLEIGFVLDAIAQAARLPRRRFGIPIRAVSSPARRSRSHWKRQVCRSVWMAKDAPTITSSPSGLWRSLKYEEVYLADYGSPREARQGIGRYFTFYNTERPHQALDYRRPAELLSGVGLAGGTNRIFSARAGRSGPGRGRCAPPAPSAQVSSVSSG